jgi:DNA-binding response OmpR family regulator
MSKERNGASILVVDDDPEIVSMLTTRLVARGYKVSSAGDGHRALELAKRERPDLVLLDVMMPGMSGWEICKRLKNHAQNGGQFTNTGVIMLTGIGESLNEMTSPLYGADAHVDKPFEFEKLEKIISSLVKD